MAASKGLKNNNFSEVANPSQTYRTFFAINLTFELQQNVANLIAALQKLPGLPKIRWVKMENLHITLRFLGDITETQYDEIVARVGDVLQASTTFVVTLTELMLFPTQYSPHAIVLQAQPVEQLTALAAKIENAIINCGIAAERRPFIPHLTIGRFSDKVNLTEEFLLEFAKYKENLPVTGLTFPVHEVLLIKSMPTPQRSLYIPLACFGLSCNSRS